MCNAEVRLNSVKCLLVFAFLQCFILGKSEDALQQGLYFLSFGVDKDKRTCLDLTPEKKLDFPQGFSMQFDLKLRMEKESFGYVFRIIGNDSLNIDLLSDLTSSGTNFSLVVKNRLMIGLHNQDVTGGRPPEEEWIKVSLSLEPDKNEISLQLNDARKVVPYQLRNLKNFGVYFGGNQNEHFSTTDIVPMIIRNIRFYDEKKNLIRNWKLEKHIGNEVFDECVFDKAVTKNPVWEIDNHIKWKKNKALQLPGMYYQMAYDQQQGRIFLAGERFVYVYHMISGQMDTIPVAEGCPYNTYSNQLVYDPGNDELISYNFDSNKLARFNFNSRSWSNNNTLHIAPSFWQHGVCFIPEDNLLFTFGGYGFHRYKSLLNEYVIADSVWKQYDLSASIEPRYLGGMARYSQDELLYFGGFGSESGRQEEFPTNYYDLYTINIKNRNVKKLWEATGPDVHFTTANSLVINEEKNNFYTLCHPNKQYATTLTLRRYRMDKPEFVQIGDSIPYFFNDTESFSDLYYQPEMSRLFAITSISKSSGSDINIYSIAYPPLMHSDVTQQPPEKSSPWKWYWFLLLLVIPLVWAFKREDSEKDNESSRNATNDLTGEVKHEMEEKEDKSSPYEITHEENKPSSINLLGNFCIIDDDGNDISNNLTPTATEILLLILLSTFKNTRGISSKELKNLLWYDKDDMSARNNRNVYINKLRAILKNVGETEIHYTDGYWSIPLSKSVFCDYGRIIVIIHTLKKEKDLKTDLLNELLEIALKGPLLPYFHSEWADNYKADYSNLVIEILLDISKKEELKNEFLLQLKIADVILLLDNIDEDAIRIKCFALFKLGRKNQAKQSFYRFVEDYEKLLAIKPGFSFDEIIKS